MSKRMIYSGLLGASLMLTGCINLDISSYFPTAQFREVLVQAGTSSNKIMILDVDGAITSGPRTQGGLLSSFDSTVTSVSERLNKARNDKNIKAVILRVDSPGGGVTASDVVYKLLADYREDTGVPIYVCMMDMATSGGYYIAMAGDEIYAHPTTITGSIGVIAMFPQIHELGNKIGVEVVAIKSGELKDMGSPFNELSTAEREVLQATINDMYNQFVNVVGKGRPELSRERILELADGRIYTAREAERLGLIDGTMYLADLVDLVTRKQRLGDPKVVLYRKSSMESVDSIYAKGDYVDLRAARELSNQSTNVSLINVQGLGIPGQDAPVFQYLWVPTLSTQ